MVPPTFVVRRREHDLKDPKGPEPANEGKPDHLATTTRRARRRFAIGSGVDSQCPTAAFPPSAALYAPWLLLLVSVMAILICNC